MSSFILFSNKHISTLSQQDTFLHMPFVDMCSPRLCYDQYSILSIIVLYIKETLNFICILKITVLEVPKTMFDFKCVLLSMSQYRSSCNHLSWNLSEIVDRAPWLVESFRMNARSTKYVPFTRMYHTIHSAEFSSFFRLLINSNL